MEPFGLLGCGEGDGRAARLDGHHQLPVGALSVRRALVAARDTHLGQQARVSVQDQDRGAVIGGLYTCAMRLRDGFPGQRLHVLPRLLVNQARQRKPTSRMLVTDAGYFPHAAMHGRSRPAGAGETILIMCANGSGWCELAGVKHDVGPNEVLIIPAGVPHSYYAAAAEPWSI